MTNTFWLVVVVALVLSILAVVGYALFEATPLAKHVDVYRDPDTHKRLWDAPHLETRDEFEQRERQS